MRGISLLWQEVQAIVRNRKMLIPIIAILFIPLLYSGMFLWAFWDPYGHLDRLPVAVVNNDKGAEFNGKTLKLGDELVNNLKTNKKFDWRFVSEKEAKKGLNDQKYYMAVIIPENFSENATTLQDKQPKPMKLIYMPNEGFNFLAAQIGDSAIEKIKEEVAKNVTKTYAETMLDSMKAMAKGIEQASGGANQLHDGVKQAKDGEQRCKSVFTLPKMGAVN